MKKIFIFFIFIEMMSCPSKRDEKEKVSSVKITGNTWIGKWKRNEWANSGVLEVIKVKEDSIYFSLFASSGANNGEVEGMAIVTSNKAKYITKEDDDDCLITFELVGDSIIKVEQVSGHCDAGMGVDYSGTYQNAAKMSAQEKTPNLIGLDIFQNETQDKAFRKLTGKDYILFVNSTQLTSDDEDLDDFNAKVKSSGIRGLFTYMENIIMITEDNRIWAAVLKDEKVYYFTNDEKYKNSLPETIENWRENFKQYEIVYK